MRSNIRKDLGKNNKGFTLVELIVVLVILAILAAILVPALLGYIDRAKSSQDLLNARNLYTAAQTVASERYAQNDPISASEDEKYMERVREIADLDNTDFLYGAIGFAKNPSDPYAGYIVEAVFYRNKNDDIYYMEKGSEWKECDLDEEDALLNNEKYNFTLIFKYTPRT